MVKVDQAVRFDCSLSNQMCALQADVNRPDATDSDEAISDNEDLERIIEEPEPPNLTVIEPNHGKAYFHKGMQEEFGDLAKNDPELRDALCIGQPTNFMTVSTPFKPIKEVSIVQRYKVGWLCSTPAVPQAILN